MSTHGWDDDIDTRTPKDIEDQLQAVRMKDEEKHKNKIDPIYSLQVKRQKLDQAINQRLDMVRALERATLSMNIAEVEFKKALELAQPVIAKLTQLSHPVMN